MPVACYMGTAPYCLQKSLPKMYLAPQRVEDKYHNSTAVFSICNLIYDCSAAVNNTNNSKKTSCYFSVY